jgi:hypothetical protein
MNAARVTCAHLFSVQMDSHQLVFGTPYVLLVINEVEDLFLHRRNIPYSGGGGGGGGGGGWVVYGGNSKWE